MGGAPPLHIYGNSAQMIFREHDKSAGHTTGLGALVLLRLALPKRREGEHNVGPHPGLPLGQQDHYHVL
jgi:hypothetical protein